MVQLMKSSDSVVADHGKEACEDKSPVKLEIAEDFTEEQHGPLSKRSKTSSSLDQVCVEFCSVSCHQRSQ